MSIRIERLEERRMLTLVHAWTFNDGTANDSVGGAHGVLRNAATIVNGWLTLQNGGSVTNVGSSAATAQHLELPAGVLPSTGSATIHVWYTTSSSVQTETRLFDFGSRVAGAADTSLYLTPRSSAGTAIAGLKPSGGTERSATLSGGTNSGFARMASVVINPASNQLQLYVDGSLVGSNTLNGFGLNNIGSALAYIGRSITDAQPAFTGSVDEVRIYSTALDATTISQHAAQGATRATPTMPARQAELLDRGLIARRVGSTTAYLSWRLLASDPSGIAFNVYRQSGSGALTKLNSTPITRTTDFNITGSTFTSDLTFFVRPVVNGVEGQDSAPSVIRANAPVSFGTELLLQKPAGGTVPDHANPGQTLSFDYSANDLSVGDVDGDGVYEIFVKWEPSNAKDNSQSGYTGNVLMDAYRLDGTRLWRVDLGRNIRAGAHYTQFMVYDFDGDGRAEMAVKTAPGTIDGQGNAVLMGSDAVTDDYRNSSGYIITGPEYLTMFNGLTGAAMATVPFEPARGTASQWGDSYGNRVDRFTGAVAYLDGERPSLVMGRGYYGPQSSSGQARNEIAAYDWRNGQLTLRWHFKAGRNINNNINLDYIGQGPHGMSIADVDGDGRDEVVYGSSVINDNGFGLHSTGLGHGDAFHVSDLDPTRPGIEIFMVHEDPGSYGANGGSFRDGRTGEIIFGIPGNGVDVGRGNSFDIDPRHLGYESWTSADGNIYNAKGQVVQGKPTNMFQNFGIWWDADPLRELLEGVTISDWLINATSGVGGRSNFDHDPATSGSQSWFPDSSGNNGTKNTPGLTVDLWGDWREEVIYRSGDSTRLRIFTSPIPATTRMPTLMHDMTYRAAVAWQNGAYNQPPHTGFFLGDGMRSVERVPLYFPQTDTRVEDRYQTESAQLVNATVASNHTGFSGTGFVDFATTGASVTWTNVEGGDGGLATLRFRYALSNTARTGRLIVNGEARDITFDRTTAWNTWFLNSVSANLLPGAVNTIRLESTGQDLGNVDEMQVMRQRDSIAPVATSTVYENQSLPQRLVLDFSERVSDGFSPANLTLTRLGVGTFTPSGLAWVNDGTRLIVNLPTLPDGNYRLDIPASALKDASGNSLNAAVALNFHQLAGDTNNDRTVDFSDLLILARNYGATSGRNLSTGNVDYSSDGAVNFSDLLILARQYGTSLPAPRPAGLQTPPNAFAGGASVIGSQASATSTLRTSTTRANARVVDDVVA